MPGGARVLFGGIAGAELSGDGDTGDGGVGVARLGCGGGVRLGGPDDGLEGVAGEEAPLVLEGGGGPTFRDGVGGAGEREGAGGTARPGVGGGAGTARAGEPLVVLDPLTEGGTGTDLDGELRFGRPGGAA
ncbi:hypothetical protein BGX28_005004 [Mortierella sp. GBA30]|nr:hypothetical protein BGX28_005004 [Mortierella sp. GBA30]